MTYCIKNEAKNFTNDERNFITNVYLPYYSADNIDDYLFYMGKLSSIFETIETCDFIVQGDFKANIEGIFYEKWLKVCEDYGTISSDVALLPDSSIPDLNHRLLTRGCSITVYPPKRFIIQSLRFL